jgi:hypothetical protein
LDIEEIPSLPEQLVPEVTTYEPSPYTTLEIITSTPKPSVEEIITPDPSPLTVMTLEPSPATTTSDPSPLTVTLEPSPATTPMDTTTPTTTARPSSKPSGEVMDSESAESETPTYQPIEIITAQDSDP